MTPQYIAAMAQLELKHCANHPRSGCPAGSRKEQSAGCATGRNLRLNNGAIDPGEPDTTGANLR